MRVAVRCSRGMRSQLLSRRRILSRVCPERTPCTTRRMVDLLRLARRSKQDLVPQASFPAPNPFAQTRRMMIPHCVRNAQRRVQRLNILHFASAARDASWTPFPDSGIRGFQNTPAIGTGRPVTLCLCDAAPPDSTLPLAPQQPTCRRHKCAVPTDDPTTIHPRGLRNPRRITRRPTKSKAKGDRERPGGRRRRMQPCILKLRTRESHTRAAPGHGGLLRPVLPRKKSLMFHSPPRPRPDDRRGPLR